MDIFSCAVFHLLKQEGSQVHENLITGMTQDVWWEWPVVLQEVNETISFCCVRTTKHTFASFVKIASRSATIGDSEGLFFSHNSPENYFLVASLSNTPYFVRCCYIILEILHTFLLKPSFLKDYVTESWSMDFNCSATLSILCIACTVYRSYLSYSVLFHISAFQFL